MRSSLHQRPVLKNWGQTDTAWQGRHTTTSFCCLLGMRPSSLPTFLSPRHRTQARGSHKRLADPSQIHHVFLVWDTAVYEQWVRGRGAHPWRAVIRPRQQIIPGSAAMATRSVPNLLRARARQTGPTPPQRSGQIWPLWRAHLATCGRCAVARSMLCRRRRRSAAAAARHQISAVRPPLSWPLPVPPLHTSSFRAAPRIVRRWRARWAPRTTAPRTAPVTAGSRTGGRLANAHSRPRDCHWQWRRGGGHSRATPPPPPLLAWPAARAFDAAGAAGGRVVTALCPARLGNPSTLHRFPGGSHFLSPKGFCRTGSPRPFSAPLVDRVAGWRGHPPPPSSPLQTGDGGALVRVMGKFRDALTPSGKVVAQPTEAQATRVTPHRLVNRGLGSALGGLPWRAPSPQGGEERSRRGPPTA